MSWCTVRPEGPSVLCVSGDRVFLMDSEYSLCICLYGWRFRGPKPPVSSSSAHLWIPLAVLNAAVSWQGVTLVSLLPAQCAVPEPCTDPSPGLEWTGVEQLLSEV